MARDLDGPRLAPQSGKATSLVVLLHGFGSNGDDLIELGRAWQPLLPETAFVAPHGPEPCEMAGAAGRQWFGLTRMEPRGIAEGCARAAPDLEGFLAGELARHGLPPSRLALVGFSQGTMMSLYVGLRLGAAPAAILGYSGLLAAPERLAAEARGRPPVFLIHGDADTTLPVEATYAAFEVLAATGMPVIFHVCAGLAHGIDQAGLTEGGGFLAEALAGRLTAALPPVPVMRPDAAR
jgi:phospholipase/carboxylesterase